MVHSIEYPLPIDFALKIRPVIDPIRVRRFGHQLHSLPLAQDPTCILAGDSRHGGNVCLIKHVGDQDCTESVFSPRFSASASRAWATRAFAGKKAKDAMISSACRNRAANSFTRYRWISGYC